MEQPERKINQDARALTWAYLRAYLRTGQGVDYWLEDTLRYTDPVEARRIRPEVIYYLRDLVQAGVVGWLWRNLRAQADADGRTA